ncbi:hypothetical protein JCM31826_16120 [Thermaurantimonas aggregans]|uniref:Uncharacterized protein n=3 Tax=Thermaurantimonas aggregans TaxID=2173829 RepID=A0A401XM84_9FLAO|nr:hypothetical protein JCM31826_16120 [Thermaurantimonas aggregans]
MKAEIIQAISLFHEMELAPNPKEIYNHIDTDVDFTSFTSMLFQMAEEGELLYENNRYALPGKLNLIDVSWNRELEIQYFINQFRAVSQFLRLFPFIKSVSISKTSFYNNSNEVFLNLIVEKDTVYTTYYLVKKLLKFFDKYSIFDTKILFVLTPDASFEKEDSEAFLIQEVYEISGDYTFKNIVNNHFEDLNKKNNSTLFGKIIAFLFEKYFKIKFERVSIKRKGIITFTDINRFLEKISFTKNLNQLIYRT